MIALLAECAYDGTIMEAIADRARVARASVFNYFRKQSILAGLAARRRRAVHDLVGARQADGQPVEATLLAYMAACAGSNEQMRAETIACGQAALRETDLLTNSGLSRASCRRR